MEEYTLAVEESDIGIRIDTFVSENTDDISRSGIQKLIENGDIKVNGKNTKSSYKFQYPPPPCLFLNRIS